MGSTSNMKTFVEGDWNQFYFRQLFESDFNEIFALVKEQFIPNEPTSMLLQPDEEYFRDYEKLLKPILGHNLSFVAVDKATGKFAAARINVNQKKHTDKAAFDLKSAKFAKIFAYIKVIDEQTRLFEKYNLDTCANCMISVVHREFRKLGLAPEMFRRTIALTRAEGFFLAVANLSNPLTRAGAATAGFKEVGRVRFCDVKGQDGEPVISGALEDQFISQSVYIL